MPKKTSKKSAKRGGRKPKQAKESAGHPLTSCGQYRLVPNGDGTAREEFVNTPGA